ncbi:MAG: response regulator transcription factor [Peptococcaceae bacterium]|jgi:two-component system KDP operon response regulator KdpE|nr:response regulator transcription factor [Peptococcaceae bacterium]
MSRLKAILAIQDMDSMRLLRANLRAAGYDISTAPGGKSILNDISDDYGDILVVGEALPDISGLEFLKLLRMQSNIPVVMMGQEEGSAGVVAALRAGADDFLAYPYSTDEFFARVGAVMRRTGRESNRIEDGKKKIGSLTIDMSQRQVIVKGKATPLTPTEFKLLVYMAERPDQVINHEELLTHVWGAEYGNYVHYLRVGIGRLRQKIEKDPSSPIYLVTCSGVGYMLQDLVNR